MPFPINILDFKEYISNKNFNLEVYNSKIFNDTLVGFSLLASMEDYINEIDCGKLFTVHNKAQWMEFLQLYYYRFNVNRNILKTILKDGVITEWDIDFVTNTIPFSIDALKSIFRDDKNKPIFFANIIFAGRFYNSLHFYIKSIDSFVQEHLGLAEKSEENLQYLKIIKDERNWIDTLYDDLKKIRETGHTPQIPDDSHEKLTIMWERTLDFFEKDLVPQYIPQDV